VFLPYALVPVNQTSWRKTMKSSEVIDSNTVTSRKKEIIEQAVEKIDHKNNEIYIAIIEGIGNDGVKLLCDLLKAKDKIKYVQTIDLSDNNIGDEGVECLINFLQKEEHNLNIKTIRLEGNNCSSTMAKNLLLVIQKLGRPIKLSLPYNVKKEIKTEIEKYEKFYLIKSAEEQIVQAVVLSEQQDRTIKLGGKSINDDGVKLLFGFLKDKDKANTRAIYLNSNDIGDEGIKVIISFLKNNVNFDIQEIWLDHNNFSPAMARKLLQTTQELGMAIKFSFSDEIKKEIKTEIEKYEKFRLIQSAVNGIDQKNGCIEIFSENIGDDGVELLLKLLKEKGKTKYVKTISLASTMISDKSIEYIIGFLKNDELNVREIDLHNSSSFESLNNNFSVKAIKKLLDAAEESGLLIDFYFPNIIAKQANKVIAIYEAKKQYIIIHLPKCVNGTALVIDYKGKKMNMIGMKILVKFLRINEKVRNIILNNCRMSDDALEVLANFLETHSLVNISLQGRGQVFTKKGVERILQALKSNPQSVLGIFDLAESSNVPSEIKETINKQIKENQNRLRENVHSSAQLLAKLRVNRNAPKSEQGKFLPEDVIGPITTFLLPEGEKLPMAHALFKPTKELRKTQNQTIIYAQKVFDLLISCLTKGDIPNIDELPKKTHLLKNPIENLILAKLTGQEFYKNYISFLEENSAGKTLSFKLSEIYARLKQKLFVNEKEHDYRYINALTTLNLFSAVYEIIREASIKEPKYKKLFNKFEKIRKELGLVVESKDQVPAEKTDKCSVM
jgi:hypothetical protein